VTRAVILDLGNVIVGLDFPRAYRAAARLTRHGAEEIPNLIRAANLARPYERGELSSREFYRRFCRALDLELSYPEFVDLWSDMFQPEPILSDVLLRELAAATRLLLLSNTNEIHFEFIRAKYPLLQHFHDFVLSYRVGAMKPDPAIYLDTVRRAGCEAGECFFVDDIEENVEAARRLGIDAEVFRSANELAAQLRLRGVLPDR
jgi:putative hydrolase of the HAD superfamily